MQLRADPNALAPERLLVFELTGSVMKFEQAVRLVPGLEFLGAEDLEEDELDDNPAVYLMVPSEGALRNIVTLWRGWQENGTVPERFSAWKALLSQLRDIRPWGPQDRITPADFNILTTETASAHTTVRVEVSSSSGETGRRPNKKLGTPSRRWAGRQSRKLASLAQVIMRCLPIFRSKLCSRPCSEIRAD